MNVSPVYSVVENPEREQPFVTVSLLYSRKPAELLADFNKRNEQHAQVKVRKSLDQYVELPRLDVNLEREAKRAARQRGTDEDILQVLKRLGKL
jgi:type II secretory pathway component GspD/PulD (secretin)